MTINWDLFVSIILFFTFFVTPYRIAFTEKDSTTWTVIDGVIDFLFLMDIILNFFMAYYNSEYILIDNRWKIALKYITTWFFIDVVAIIPINLITEFTGGNSTDFTSLARLSKLPRLYRLIKMLRLV